jgi:hypothetical protein
VSTRWLPISSIATSALDSVGRSSCAPVRIRFAMNSVSTSRADSISVMRARSALQVRNSKPRPPSAAASSAAAAQR